MILAKDPTILFETRYRYVTYGRNVRGGELHSEKIHSENFTVRNSQ